MLMDLVVELGLRELNKVLILIKNTATDLFQSGKQMINRQPQKMSPMAQPVTLWADTHTLSLPRRGAGVTRHLFWNL